MKEFIKIKLDRIEVELKELEIREAKLWDEYLKDFSPTINGTLTFVKEEIRFLRGQKMAYELVEHELKYYGGN